MSVTLTKVGTLAVRNGEAITGIRRKVADASRLVGFSDVDASRLAATVSEIGHRLLSAEAGASIDVYLKGTNPIEGLALSFPEYEVVADILNRSHYFDHLAATEEDESKSLLALKNLRGKGAALDDQKLLQIEELLSRPSREELMGELQSTNEELEAHQVNLERTVAERTAELRQSQAQFRLALDNMTGGMLMIDRDLKILVVNDQYSQLYSLPDELLAPGKSIKDMFRYQAERGDYGPGDRDQLIGQMVERFSSGQSAHYERHLPNGRTIVVYLAPTPDGGVVAVGRDISEQKLLDEKLRKSEQTFKAVVDQLPAAIGLKDHHDRYTLANRTFHEWFAKQGQDVVGLTTNDLYPKEVADEILDIDRCIRETGENITKEITEPFADGSEHILLMTKFPIQDTDGNITVGAVETDITERKQAERRLQESEARLRNILDSSPFGVSIVTIKTDERVYSNPPFNEMFGGDHDLSMADRKITDSWMDPKDQEEFQRLGRDSGWHYDCEGLRKRADGTPWWCMMSSRPIDYEGQSARMVWHFDITERKKAEEELVIARDAAEQATKAKATFLATMSHEIRTPMNGVIGMVDLLQQSKMTDDQRQMINTVGDSAQSLLTIINDILDFSKIEAGKLDLEEIPISVCDVVESAGEALAVSARNKNIGLSVYVDPDIPDALVGDQVRLRQILFNFGSNAIKFTEKGKVLIRADRVPSRAKKKVTVRFQVIDDGIGIPEDAQKKLFQAFSQVEASTTRRFGGTGLGLSICQRLTEMMNGEIGVESVPGEGATFSATITLAAAEEHTIKSDGHELNELSVLLAIGDDDMRELIPRYLEQWGAKVTAIAEISEVKSLALKAAKGKKPFNVIGLNSAWPLAERISLVESLAAEKALSSTRYVLACFERTTADRKKLDNTVYVDSDPLWRGAFIKSVAVAAGRASPEVEPDESGITLDAGKAPTVAEAEAMGQLILLAEDNLTNQDVIYRQLTMLGYALEIANDGKEALELLESKSFAILLTDCHMPNMDGLELTETIRKSEKGKDVRFPIVAITASVMKEEVDRCIAAGMDDCLAKPLEMKTLRETLHKLMPPPSGDAKPKAKSKNDLPAKDKTEKPKAKDVGDGGDGPVDPTALKSVFGDDEATFK